LAVEGVEFYSLQKVGPEAPRKFTLVDMMDVCNDFADAAAFIMNLDLIISVDTAVAHLAGALGKKVWLLNHFDSCWRWLKTGDWESVMLCVQEKLQKVVESRC